MVFWQRPTKIHKSICFILLAIHKSSEAIYLFLSFIFNQTFSVAKMSCKKTNLIHISFGRFQHGMNYSKKCNIKIQQTISSKLMPIQLEIVLAFAPFKEWAHSLHSLQCPLVSRKSHKHHQFSSNKLKMLVSLWYFCVQIEFKIYFIVIIKTFKHKIHIRRKRMSKKNYIQKLLIKMLKTSKISRLSIW